MNFDDEDPGELIREMTRGIGPDRVIEAVGVEAEPPRSESGKEPHAERWKPGEKPSQAVEWAVETVAKAGTLSIIGVYPPDVESFPIGQAMTKNLTITMGNCSHRTYIPRLIELVRTGAIDPTAPIARHEHVTDAIEAHEAFDRREEGWLKVALDVGARV